MSRAGPCMTWPLDSLGWCDSPARIKILKMAASPRLTLPALIARFAGRLRFPQLFLFTGGLFLLDVLIPDLIPFADEVLLGLITLLFGMFRKPEAPKVTTPGDKPPMKDVTPQD